VRERRGLPAITPDVGFIEGYLTKRSKRRKAASTVDITTSRPTRVPSLPRGGGMRLDDVGEVGNDAAWLIERGASRRMPYLSLTRKPRASADSTLVIPMRMRQGTNPASE